MLKPHKLWSNLVGVSLYPLQSFLIKWVLDISEKNLAGVLDLSVAVESGLIAQAFFGNYA